MTFTLPTTWLARIRHPLLGLLGLLLLSGCFASDVPAITPATADNVGAELSYRVYSLRNRSPVFIRLQRSEGRSYDLQLVEPTDGRPESMTLARGVLVRAIGRRGDSPTYAIQIDATQLYYDPDLSPEGLGFRYLLYLVSIDETGGGTSAITSCDGQLQRRDVPILDQLRGHGLRVDCPYAPSLDGAGLRIQGRPSPETLWTAITDIVGTVPLPWEDRVGIAVFDIE